MRLFSHICIKTVKWRLVAAWSILIMGWMTYSYWGMWAQFVIVWGIYFCLMGIIVGGVWARSIHGMPEAYVGFSWIWAHSLREPELSPPYDSNKAAIMRIWCHENLEGGWTQCRNGGFFAFRKKSDALAFKLRWL